MKKRQPNTFFNRLVRDTSGIGMIEFAYCLPMLTLVTCYGLEVSYYASVNQRLSQSAMALADNMSRVGMESALSKVQLRESDVNDGFLGVAGQTKGLDFANRGRVILSSLERNASNGQWIHWQRCYGALPVTSQYGAQNTGQTGTSFLGMGAATARVQAPANSSVMFVELVYQYKPLFGSTYLPINKQIRYEASFITRDERDMSGAGIFNPSPAATVANC